ncbi:bacterio-opsin activator domain-containing protein [Halosolutus gelatinilyticus]|uniref:bacterio-opsin activator domain-containing protein n=1 Tax=Halosolutus gelatinilyticus TaxID=2931975 RepID=UPI001FF63E61|nr:bacterio-opsin activator domain-containing protein [Halosolutus gelatinilyticus]
MSLVEIDAGLTRRRYESLLDAAETYREALVVRLCGEVGLRPPELTRLTVGDIEQVRTDPPRYFLRIPTDDGDRTDRTAYLPTHVERELRRYVRSNGLADDDPIFAVTPRRLQMLVSGVADRASERVDDPSLADVATNDLRRYFARTALVDHEINPRAVKAAGGWRSFEALESYLPEPSDDELVDAFAGVERSNDQGRGRPETATAHAISDDSLVRSLFAASDRCAVVRLDEDGYVDRWNRSAASMFGYRAGEIVGTHLSTFYTDDDRDVPERTLQRARENDGYEGDAWLVRGDGSRFRAVETVSPLRCEDGRHRGYALFVCDVSTYHEHVEDARSARDELDRLYAVARSHRDVTRSLLSAADHEEVETETCAALTAAGAYEFAWIDRTVLADRRREWRASGGIEPGAVEPLVPTDWRDTDPPTDGADVAVVQAPDVAGSVDVETVSLARVALSYGDTVYGTLTVASGRPEAFDETERTWLETIGRQVGYAIAAVRRRNLLLSDRVLELELVCRDDRSFFVDASRRFGCRFELDSLVAVSETTHLYYARLEGAPPSEIFDRAAADPGIEDCRLIETYEGGCRLEFVVEGSTPTLTLTEYGVTVLEATIEEGRATIAGECAADADLRTIVNGVRSAFPECELAGKRETERTVQTAQEFREGLKDRLTDRQEAALRAAYFGGYYDWPRESTAEEVADAMGISSPTLHNHLRKGQHELLRTFFDDPASGE